MSVLNIGTAVNLGALLAACQHGRRVTWSPDGGDTIFEGVARAICRRTPDGYPGGFLSAHDDVRDGYMWVSGITETTLPVEHVLYLMGQELFVIAAG